MSLISGQDFPPEKYNSLQAGIPYITGASNLVDNEIMVNRWTEYPSVISENGDLLVVCKGAGVGKMAENSIGKAHIARQIQAVRNTLHILLPKYVRIVIEYNIQNIIAQANGLIPGLKREALLALLIPIPPIEEQKRIVDEVVKWFIQIDAIEQDSSDLKDAVQKAKSKILDLALSGRLTSHTSHYPQLPQSQVTRWDAKTIDEIFYHNTGKALNKSDSEGELYDYITTSNLYWNKFDLSSVRKMKFKSSEIEKCSVRKGDLLICEGGDVGRAAVWNYDFNIMIQNHIHRLRCRLEANPKFYYYVMMYYKSKGMISGKGIGLMGLSSKELGKLQVPYPQIEEQNDIVTYLDYTMKVFDSIAD